MAKKHKYYFINWIDGMKINKDHFIGIENAVICQQSFFSKSLLTPFNYGILPGVNGELPLDISCRIDSNNRVNIKVNRCRAITEGGIIIDIDSEYDELSEFETGINNFDPQSAESKSGRYYIVLKVNPYGRIPVGSANPSENPPRHPYIVPDCDVSVVPIEQMGKNGFGDFFQVIGKIVLKDNIPATDTEYIPPCSRVSANERLMAMESTILAFYSKLETDIFTIIRKIHTKQQKSPLANSVLYLADKLAAFQGLNITRQRLYMKHSPPVVLFESAVCFASFLKNTLNTLTPESKEELINYFSDWCNLKQGELEKLIVETSVYNYNHNEIADVMSKMILFIETMSALFETLGHLDYIGKRRDTQIYIKEEEKPRKSFLADD